MGVFGGKVLCTSGFLSEHFSLSLLGIIVQELIYLLCAWCCEQTATRGGRIFNKIKRKNFKFLFIWHHTHTNTHTHTNCKNTLSATVVCYWQCRDWIYSVLLDNGDYFLFLLITCKSVFLDYDYYSQSLNYALLFYHEFWGIFTISCSLLHMVILCFMLFRRVRVW